MKVDFDKLDSELKTKLNQIRDELRQHVRTEFNQTASGELARGFQGSIKRNFGMPDTMVWRTQRHSYILHHGIDPGTESNRPGGSWTYKNGLRQSNFITDVIDRHINEIGDIVQRNVGDVIVSDAANTNVL